MRLQFPREPSRDLYSVCTRTVWALAFESRRIGPRILFIADQFVLSYRTSTRSSTSTARRSGTTKRLPRGPLKDGARANGHLYASGRLLYTRTVMTEGESCGWTCHCDYRRFVHSIRCSDKESIGNRSLHFICHKLSHSVLIHMCSDNGLTRTVQLFGNSRDPLCPEATVQELSYNTNKTIGPLDQ
jgi:hypothetical protein